MTALTAAERALDEYINPEGAGPQLYPAEIHGIVELLRPIFAKEAAARLRAWAENGIPGQNIDFVNGVVQSAVELELGRV